MEAGTENKKTLLSDGHSSGASPGDQRMPHISFHWEVKQVTTDQQNKKKLKEVGESLDALKNIMLNMSAETDLIKRALADIAAVTVAQLHGRDPVTCCQDELSRLSLFSDVEVTIMDDAESYYDAV